MQAKTLRKVPSHLQRYIVEQNYEKYTPRDQAVWRFIMRNAKDFLVANAHPAYLSGLKATGVPIETIPRISEMNERFGELGWGTVCVCGFIPPLAFLEFLANRILPIAADMRTLEHFDYTPAPDIVHEAAGHAPILADREYRDYMANYARVARKGIFSKEDIDLYEAIRVLSDLKENPDSTPQLIEKAEANLKKAYEGITWVSEAAEISRMFWWTIEYGLVGDMQNPKLYGAGLLSSLGEGRDSLEANVRKVPLSLKCVETGYDITEPQPQLFVARDFHHVSEMLAELESKLAFRIGGQKSLELAKKAESLTTTQFDSGVEVSGVLTEFLCNEDQLAFLRWKGAVQLCENAHELPNQGVTRHPDGFSSPVGSWVGTAKAPHLLQDAELAKLGLQRAKTCILNFASGFKISGKLEGWIRGKNGDLLVLTWTDCTVTCGDKVYFEPSWGSFDQIVGLAVPSVYGGPSDWPAYGSGDFGKASTQPGRQTPYTDSEKHLFKLYAQIREERVKKQASQETLARLQKIAQDLMKNYPKEWLLALELSECVHAFAKHASETPWYKEMQESVLNLANYTPRQSRFIKMGLDLAARVQLSQ